MLTLFVLLADAAGVLRLARQWGGGAKTLAGALVVLAGLPEFVRPFLFPVPLGITIGLFLPELLVWRG